MCVVVRPRHLTALVALGCGPHAPPVPEPDADGMVELAAGELVMGRDRSPNLDERPAHRVRLSAFRMDSTLVTMAAFRTWVEATGATTSAERLGYGMVAVAGMGAYEWHEVPGASWRQPFGPARPELVPADDHPVTGVAWVDADAYCRAHGKRLPTEAQWEYAMRAGSSARYPWGDSPVRDGRYGINFWQGIDHTDADPRDGWLYTSPVRAFPPNAWGLYDPVGNVWQFTADWYAADTFATTPDGALDPTGPPSGWARVARGGSWWCSASTCSAYGLFERGKQHPLAPYPNNGFRCVADPLD